MLNVISQNLSEKEFVNNPYTAYENFFKLPKIFYWKEFGMPVTQNYKLVKKIFNDKRFVRKPPSKFFNNLDKEIKPFFLIEKNSMFENDGDLHRKLRAPFQNYFNKKNILILKKDIERISKELLKNIDENEFDFIKCFAEKLPVIIISRLLGFPEEMHSQLSKWSKNMVNMYQPASTKEKKLLAVKSSEDFYLYLSSFIKEKEKKNENDIITHLIKINNFKNRLSLQEIIPNIILLLNAGNEATTHLIGNSLYTLLKLKISHNKIKNEKNIFNELIRYDPPLHFFSRFAKERLIIEDHIFEEGSSIGLLIAAANRDPKIFERPNTFIVNRNNNNISLGIGEHFCLGSHLAKLELQSSINEVYNIYPKLSINRTPTYLDSFHFRGLKELKLLKG